MRKMLLTLFLLLPSQVLAGPHRSGRRGRWCWTTKLRTGYAGIQKRT